MSEAEPNKEYIVPIICHYHGHVKVRASSPEDADAKVKLLTNKHLMKYFRGEYNFVTRNKARDSDGEEG